MMPTTKYQLQIKSMLEKGTKLPEILDYISELEDNGLVPMSTVDQLIDFAKASSTTSEV